MKKLTRIGLIEPFDHSEVLYTLCELLLEQEVEILVFCQQYIAEDCPKLLRSHQRIHWNTFAANERKQFFLHEQARLNQCQLLIWITAPPPAYAWINRLELRVPVVLLIHNLYTWMAPWTNLQLSRSSLMESILDLGRLMRFVFWQRPQQRNLLKKAAAIGVPSQNMLEVAKRFSNAGQMPKAVFVPFAYRTKHVHASENEESIEVIIPGVVTRNGRDYELVAKAFEDALPHFKSPVHLILLGKAMQISAIRPFKDLELKHTGFSVTSFQKRLPQKTYDEYLGKAHFMILPYTAYQKFGIIREKWGVSKISGGVSDMIRFGIPAICSIHYQLDPEARSLTTSFSTREELAALLIYWVNQRAYLNPRFLTQRMDKSVLSTQLFKNLSQLLS